MGAIVSRGGRPDLAGPVLQYVRAPSLLIVGGNDRDVFRLNCRALAELPSHSRLEIVPGATHLFEEPGALETVADLAADWFGSYCSRASGHLGTSATNKFLWRRPSSRLCDCQQSRYADELVGNCLVQDFGQRPCQPSSGPRASSPKNRSSKFEAIITAATMTRVQTNVSAVMHVEFGSVWLRCALRAVTMGYVRSYSTGTCTLQPPGHWNVQTSRVS